MVDAASMIDAGSALPLGDVVDAGSARRPEPVILQGRFGRVEKLAIRHASDLWRAVEGHDRIWTYMSSGPFAGPEAFSSWIAERAAIEDPYSFAVVDPALGAIGIVTLMALRPAMRVCEVGHIVYAPALQRTPLGTEAQYLLARYVFETLGYRRYEWKCDALNEASRRAALRYGFSLEGVFRQHMIVKQRNRDTAWFAMLDSEWPARKARFERWLAPENFDSEGGQRMGLSALNAASPDAPGIG